MESSIRVTTYCRWYKIGFVPVECKVGGEPTSELAEAIW